MAAFGQEIATYLPLKGSEITIYATSATLKLILFIC